MKVLTIKSDAVLDEEMQTEIHHTFGMEHHTDYVFKPRGNQSYSATIVLAESGPVIREIITASGTFPETGFVIDDLDMEQNRIERYLIKGGKVTEQLQSGWNWER